MPLTTWEPALITRSAWRRATQAWLNDEDLPVREVYRQAQALNRLKRVDTRNDKQ